METVIYEIQLKDGTILEIEGQPGQEEEAKKRALEYQASLQETPKVKIQDDLSKTDKALDILKTAGGSFYKGLSYIPGFIGDIEQLGQEFLPEWMTKPIIPGAEPTQVFPTSEKVREVVSGIVPPLKAAEAYQPQTREAELIGGAIEFAAPGVASKAKRARRLGTAIGGTTGLLYESIRPYSETTAAAASIPTALTLSLLARPSKAAQLLEEPVARLTPVQISEAKKIEEAAKRIGIKLTPGESLDSDEIRLMVQDVYSTEKGYPYLYEQFKDRPANLLKEAEAQKKLIGEPIASKRELREKISSTALEAVGKIKQYRKSESQKAGYAVANTESLDPDQVFTVMGLIDDEIKALGSKNPNTKKLKDLKDQLIRKTIHTEIDGKKKLIIVPETNINRLDSLFKRTRDSYKKSSSGAITDTRDPLFIDSELGQKYFNPEGNGILDTLKANLNTNPNYKSGNKTYELLSKNVDYVIRNVDPLLGTQRKAVTNSKIKEFIFNSDSNNVDDIKATYKILNDVEPQAWIDIANLYFRNAVNKAFPINKIRKEDLNAGFKLANAIAPNENQRKNLLAVLDGVAQAKKLNKQQTRDFKIGFERMLDVFERSGRIINMSKPGYDVTKSSKETIAKDVAMAKTFNPLVRLSTKYAEIRSNAALSDLGKLFASDDAIDEMIRLAKTDPKSKAAITKTLNIILATEQIKQSSLQEEPIPQ